MHTHMKVQVPVEARREHQIPLKLIWVLGIELGPLREQEALLGAEQSLQPHPFLILTSKTVNINQCV